MSLRLAVIFVLIAVPLAGQTKEQLITVPLIYAAPSGGPQPNFSPKGTQVPLTALSESGGLPAGSVLPAKRGVMQVGPGWTSRINVLTTATAEHPQDLCRLFVDLNRNGKFGDDGPAIEAKPTQNEKTKAWWSSFARTELSIPYAGGVIEPYLVSFWIVREGETPPDIMRFSVNSWRAGHTTIRGVDALVAAMDSDNDAIFKDGDMWSVLETTATEAPKAVLSITEARNTSRFMFVSGGPAELVLKFRSFSPDGRSITFAVVDLPVTKAADRRPDDLVGPERARPRAQVPFTWRHSFDAALKEAARTQRSVIVDFETTWCGPCKSMDEWVWTDAELAGVLTSGFVGVKLDGDIEKALVSRFKVAGYPTVLILDPSGKEQRRFVGYQSSKETLEALAKRVGAGFSRP